MPTTSMHDEDKVQRTFCQIFVVEHVIYLYLHSRFIDCYFTVYAILCCSSTALPTRTASFLFS